MDKGRGIGLHGPRYLSRGVTFVGVKLGIRDSVLRMRECYRAEQAAKVMLQFAMFLPESCVGAFFSWK